MQNSILIVAAGPLQVPAFKEAAALGLRTVAVDANPSAPGMSVADASYTVDIFNVPAVEAIARSESISGIMTLCTDAPVRTVAAVANALGLAALSPSAAANATDKRLMRKALWAHLVPAPAYREIETAQDALEAGKEIGYPLAMKIPCSSGSRGVYRVEREEDLSLYLPLARKYHPTGSLLLEEWMDGEEVSIEAVCVGNRIHIVQITDKQLFDGAFPVESGHSQPSRLPQPIVDKICLITKSGVRALDLSDCAIHAEVIVTSTGPKIVEIGAPPGG